MNPRYPVYIPTKGRANTATTPRALDLIGVHYRLIVEAQEFDQYAKVYGPERILTLPTRLQEEYDPCDELGMTKSKGSGPARNFAWEHSISLGTERHWVLDDNISSFHRLNRNRKPRVNSGTAFLVMEEFTERYENIALSGPNYFKFAKATDAIPPFVQNTRLYSCILIKNDLPLRWRGRYNEDTDLSLRVLKAGYATVQFNVFLAEKLTTQKMKGGNTDELYADGTKEKSEMIARLHPDVAIVTEKFNRWHHHVDYSEFDTELIRRPGFNFSGINNYGMKLEKVA